MPRRKQYESEEDSFIASDDDLSVDESEDKYADESTSEEENKSDSYIEEEEDDDEGIKAHKKTRKASSSSAARSGPSRSKTSSKQFKSGGINRVVDDDGSKAEKRTRRYNKETSESKKSRTSSKMEKKKATKTKTTAEVDLTSDDESETEATPVLQSSSRSKGLARDGTFSSKSRKQRRIVAEEQNDSDDEMTRRRTALAVRRSSMNSSEEEAEVLSRPSLKNMYSVAKQATIPSSKHRTWSDDGDALNQSGKPKTNPCQPNSIVEEEIPSSKKRRKIVLASDDEASREAFQSPRKNLSSTFNQNEEVDLERQSPNKRLHQESGVTSWVYTPNDSSPAEARIYLNVPIDEKDAAKALGARWDAAKKQWYFSTDLPIEPFKKWFTKVDSKSICFTPRSQRIDEDDEEEMDDEEARSLDSFIAPESSNEESEEENSEDDEDYEEDKEEDDDQEEENSESDQEDNRNDEDGSEEDFLQEEPPEELFERNKRRQEASAEKRKKHAIVDPDLEEPMDGFLYCSRCKTRMHPDNFSARQRKVEENSARYCLKHSSTSAYNQSAVVKVEREDNDTDDEEGKATSHISPSVERIKRYMKIGERAEKEMRNVSHVIDLASSSEEEEL